ncbi:hypothetical protein TWF281_002806 [Arthrobotrys megalospora]
MPLLSLPNEILSRIFDYIFADRTLGLWEPQYLKAAPLNLVCRRFRALSIDLLYYECMVEILRDPSYKSNSSYGYALGFHRKDSDSARSAVTGEYMLSVFTKYAGYVKSVAFRASILSKEYVVEDRECLTSPHVSTFTTPLLRSFTNLTTLVFLNMRNAGPLPIGTTELIPVLLDIFKVCTFLRKLELFLGIEGPAPDGLESDIATRIANADATTLTALESLRLSLLIGTDSQNRYPPPFGHWFLSMFSTLIPFSETVKELTFDYLEYDPARVSGSFMLEFIHTDVDGLLERINPQGLKIVLPNVHTVKMGDVNYARDEVAQRVFDKFFVIGKRNT